MDLRLRFSFNHYRKRICRVKFLIEHFRIWIYDCGFHSIISRRGFAECEFQSSLGLGLDFEPGFASRVWTRPHNRPIRVYVSDPRPILLCPGPWHGHNAVFPQKKWSQVWDTAWSLFCWHLNFHLDLGFYDYMPSVRYDIWNKLKKSEGD